MFCAVFALYGFINCNWPTVAIGFVAIATCNMVTIAAHVSDASYIMEQSMH